MLLCLLNLVFLGLQEHQAVAVVVATVAPAAAVAVVVATVAVAAADLVLEHLDQVVPG